VYDSVQGLDLSVRAIEAPANLQATGRQRYICQDEGELKLFREVLLSDFDGYEEVKSKIAFMQGDACNLVPKYSGYDLVFAGNLGSTMADYWRWLHLTHGAKTIRLAISGWVASKRARAKALQRSRASAQSWNRTLEWLGIVPAWSF